MIISTASAPSPRCRTITALTTMPPRWLRRCWSALVVPSCVATWPIEEMPHDDVAGFCLAAPRNYVSGEGSRWAPLVPWRRWYALYALIWADLWREGPISAYVAVADDNLHYNYIIEASVKHPAERIRNTDSRRISEKRGRRRGWSQAGRSYNLGRSSIRSRCILEGWIWRLRAVRGTTHAAGMYMIPSPPHGLTSVKGRSFGLSYAEMVTSSTE